MFLNSTEIVDSVLILMTGVFGRVIEVKELAWNWFNLLSSVIKCVDSKSASVLRGNWRSPVAISCAPN